MLMNKKSKMLKNFPTLLFSGLLFFALQAHANKADDAACASIIGNIPSCDTLSPAGVVDFMNKNGGKPLICSTNGKCETPKGTKLRGSTWTYDGVSKVKTRGASIADMQQAGLYGGATGVQQKVNSSISSVNPAPPPVNNPPAETGNNNPAPGGASVGGDVAVVYADQPSSSTTVVVQKRTTSNVVVSTRNSMDGLVALCVDNDGILDTLIIQNADEQNGLSDQIDAAEKGLRKAKSDLLEAFKAMSAECSALCVDIAFGAEGVSHCPAKEKLCKNFNSTDYSSSPQLKKWVDGLAADHPCALGNINTNRGSACGGLLGKVAFGDEIKSGSCADEFSNYINEGNCPSYKTWSEAHTAQRNAEATLAKLTARRSMYEHASMGCQKLKVGFDYSGCPSDAIRKAKEACERALADALSRQQDRAGNGGYCADCGTYGSKAMGTAAMINAIGGIAVPLGLGAFQYGMGVKGINAYKAMYMEQLKTCAAVGIPCPPPSPYGGMGGAGMWGGAIGGGAYGGVYGGGAYGGVYGGGAYGMGMMLNANMFVNANMMMGPNMYAMAPNMYAMQNSMMQGNMMQGNMNLMTVQQQMYENQIRMAEMANQNMIAQQSYYSPYSQAGSPWMATPPYNPYYSQAYYPGAGVIGSVNAIGGVWANGGVGVNTYPGYYNPYMYNNYSNGCGGNGYVSIPCGCGNNVYGGCY